MKPATLLSPLYFLLPSLVVAVLSPIGAEAADAPTGKFAARRGLQVTPHGVPPTVPQRIRGGGWPYGTYKLVRIGHPATHAIGTSATDVREPARDIVRRNVR